jgi:hypothetical protein
MIPNTIKIAGCLVIAVAVVTVIMGCIGLIKINTNVVLTDKWQKEQDEGIASTKNNIAILNQTLEASKDSIFPQREETIKTRDLALKYLSVQQKIKEDFPRQIRMAGNIGGIITTVWGIILGIIGLKLFSLKQWARISIIVLSSISILQGLIGMFKNPIYAALEIIFFSVIIISLCTKNAQNAFSKSIASE